MEKFRYIILIAVLISFHSWSAVPQSERDALVALYNSTDGDNWTDNTNWLVGDPCDNAWYGVTCNTGVVIELDLGRNNLVGVIPSEIGDLVNLLWLELDSNELSGNIPKEIGGLANLTELNLRFNKLTGEIPSSIGNLLNLTGMKLIRNQLTGSIPVQIANLNNLYYLELAVNELEGNIPIEITTMANLSSVSIGGNNFSGSIPPELGNMPNLEFLHVAGNSFDGEIPTELCNISTLEVLDLGENLLTGGVPACLGQLTSLTRLELNDNFLTGELPIELTQLVNLTRLSVWNNQLTGPVHPGFGNLSSLEWFHLNSNMFSGTIPPELGNISTLEELLLDNNQLEGSIPAELGNITGLRILRLQNNQLTGIIPSSLTNLINLRIPQPGFWFEYDKSSVQYNSLTTDDQALNDFLDTHCVCDWSKTQTIIPQNLSVVSVSDESISLSWDVIEYLNDQGGYNINYATNAAGPYTLAKSVSSKALNHTLIDGLSPNTEYHFKIDSFTNSHENNQNLLVSEQSSEVSQFTDTSPGQEINLNVEMSFATDLLPGGQVTQYTLSAENIGPGDAMSSTLFHVIPHELSDVTWSCEAFSGASCPINNKGVSNGDMVESIDLPSGSYVVFTVNGTVSETESLSPLAASIAIPNSTNDQDFSNNLTVNDRQIGIFGNSFEN